MKVPSRRSLRLGILALACVFASIVAVAAALPSLIQWGLRRGLEQLTGMRASVGDVALNLRTGEARIGELRVTHPRSGTLVAGWNGMRARIRYAPLLLGTVRFQELAVERPVFALARGEDRPEGDAIPLSAFAARRSGGLLTPAVDLRRLEITGGRITFFDAVGEGGTIRVEYQHVLVSDFRTPRADPGRQTLLEMSARWEGGRIELSGWVKPAAQPPEADLSLRVVDLDLSLVDALLFAARGSGLARTGKAGGPGLLDLPLTVRGGRADATAHVARSPAGNAQGVGALELRQPAVEFTNGRGQASAQVIKVAVGAFDLETFTLRDARIEVQSLHGDLSALAGIVGHVGSAQATVGSFDFRQRSARSVKAEVTGLAVNRDQDATAMEGHWLRFSVEGCELPSRAARGITLEGAGLAFRGLGGGAASGSIGTVRAGAEFLDLTTRSGRGIRFQANGLAADGLGPHSLTAAARTVRVAADGVSPGAQAMQGLSIGVEGAAVRNARRPLGSLEAARATAAAVNLAARSGTGLRFEADQAALAGLGPQGVSARLQSLRAAAKSADLRSRAVQKASLAVDWLAAAREGEAEPFVILRAARAEVPRVDLAQPALEVERIEVDAPTVRVRRDASGIDLSRLIPGEGAAGGAGPAMSPAAVSVAFAQIREGALQFSDATVSPEASLALQDITVNLLNARPGGAAPATLVVSARTGAAGSIQVGAQFTPGTFQNATGNARLQAIDVDLARPYLRLPAPLAAITGRLTVDAEARPASSSNTGGPGALGWKIVGRAEGRGLAGRDAGGKVLAELPVLDLRDIEVTVPDFRVVVGDVAVSGLKLPVERDAARIVRVAGIPIQAFPRPPADVPRPPTGGMPPVRVRQARITGSVPLVDRARLFPLETGLTDLVLELHDVGTAGDAAMGLQLRGRLEELAFAAAGAVRLGPLQGEAYLDLKSLDLVRWADYLPDAIRGRLADLRGDARLDVTFGPRLADLLVRGQVEAAPLQLADPESGAGVLGVERATIAVERLTLDPLNLHLSTVVLEQPWMAIERRADGRVNIVALVPPHAPAAAAAPGGRPSWGSITVAIDRLTVKRGIFDVADRTMDPPFAERLRGVAAEVENLSTEGSAKARFTLSGRFRDNSNLSIEGVAVPQADHPSVEFSGRLAGFNLVGLSPYVRGLTSHRVRRGKIDIDAHYRLEAREMEGQNRIRIDQLDVGEAEEWPDRFTERVGVSLPFAVSLLQDSDGVIQIEVPVRGDLAHPQFDFGDAIRTATANAVVATVAAPLRLIGKIFAGDGRIDAIQIEPVLFEAGSAGLDAAGRQGVERLVAFLNEAPRVRIQLAGYAEPEQDGNALRAAEAARAARGGIVRRLAGRLGLGAGAPSGPDLQGLARRRAVAVQEAVRRAGVDPARVFQAEPVVEGAAQARERGKPVQGRVEIRLMP